VYKHTLYFSSAEERRTAQTWIIVTFSGIEDYDVPDDGKIFFFCTAFPLTLDEKRFVTSIVAPHTFLSEEL
jgi:hypothetical protein